MASLYELNYLYPAPSASGKHLLLSLVDTVSLNLATCFRHFISPSSSSSGPFLWFFHTRPSWYSYYINYSISNYPPSLLLLCLPYSMAGFYPKGFCGIVFGENNTVSFFHRTTDCDRILLQNRVEHTFNRRIKVVHIAMQY